MDGWPGDTVTGDAVQPHPGQRPCTLQDELFGRGFLLPGGEAEILRLVRPLPLITGAKVLVVGAGVAGPARALARRRGAQVRGYERLTFIDQGLPPVLDATAAITPVQDWRPGQDPLPARAFHHALALTPLADGPPEPVLASIVQALRPGGHLVMVEYALAGAALAVDPGLGRWMAEAPRRQPPGLVQDLSRVLARLGVQIRCIDDVGLAQARQAVYDWRRLLGTLQQRLEQPRARVLMQQAASWALQAELLQYGTLRLMRWHVVLPG